METTDLNSLNWLPGSQGGVVIFDIVALIQGSKYRLSLKNICSDQKINMVALLEPALILAIAVLTSGTTSPLTVGSIKYQHNLIQFT